MSVELVIAFDPGKTTGWASYHLASCSFASGQADFTETCELAEQHAEAWGERLLLVCESFIITVNTARNTQAPWSLELIGVLRRNAQRWTKRDLVLQQPSAAKRYASDNRLKKLGWYVPGQGHANDAARHLGLTLASRKLVSDQTLLALL